MKQIIIYSATGCTRCKIVKNFMEDNGIDYIEKDMKAEGKTDFQKFYSANRKVIYRGAEGLEFPIIADGTVIRQGIGASIAYLHSGTKLDGFFSVGALHKEWVDGLHISGGSMEYGEEFLAVLRYLKQNNMKLQFDTYGRNSAILAQIQAENLASVVIMEVVGLPELCGEVFGVTATQEEIVQTIQLVTQAPAYKFHTTVVPVLVNDEFRYLTPTEVAVSAQLLERVTDSNKQPYLIRLFRREQCKEEGLVKIEPLPVSMLLSYRTLARRYQVFTEVEKE